MSEVEWVPCDFSKAVAPIMGFQWIACSISSLIKPCWMALVINRRKLQLDNEFTFTVCVFLWLTWGAQALRDLIMREQELSVYIFLVAERLKHWCYHEKLQTKILPQWGYFEKWCPIAPRFTSCYSEIPRWHNDMEQLFPYEKSASYFAVHHQQGKPHEGILCSTSAQEALVWVSMIFLWLKCPFVGEEHFQKGKICLLQQGVFSFLELWSWHWGSQ